MVTELETARNIILEHTKPVDEEMVSLKEAIGRVLAEDISAEMNVPPFASSAMDGFAFSAADTVSASSYEPASLKVLDNIKAGSFFAGELPPGACVRIMTGAPIPNGADAVAPQEEVPPEAAPQDIEPLRNSSNSNVVDGSRIWLYRQYSRGENLTPAGKEIPLGELIMRRGTLLKETHLSALASQGRERVRVYRKPLWGVFATGTELVTPGEKISPAQIYDSNGIMIKSLVYNYGGTARGLGPVPDRKDSLLETLHRALETCHGVITSGGVSLGDYDLMPAVVEEAGARILFHGVNLKPGTPTLAAVKGDRLIVCLSGSPGAAWIAFEQLVRPAVLRMTGRHQWRRPCVPAILEHDISRSSGSWNRSSRDWNRYTRMHCYYREGDFYARAPGVPCQDPGKGPGVDLSTSLNYNALLALPAGIPPPRAGQRVQVELLMLPEVW